MKQFSNYEETKVYGERPEKLPAGAYEGVIMNARCAEKEGKNGGTYTVLEIQVDITAGDYAYYFREDYSMRKEYDDNAKWRGVLRLFVPSDDGSEEDNTRKSIFKTNITAIEASNSGFAWDWDENKLKGLKAGILIRDEEYEVGNRYGFTPRPFRLCDINLAREGKIKTPKPKYMNGAKAPKYPNGIKPDTANSTAAPTASATTAGVQSPEDVYPF